MDLQGGRGGEVEDGAQTDLWEVECFMFWRCAKALLLGRNIMVCGFDGGWSWGIAPINI